MGVFVMSIYRKIYGLLNSTSYHQFATSNVKVRDYGKTYVQLSKNCITGCGKLTINANAIDRHEYSKIRMRGGLYMLMEKFHSLPV